MHAANEKKRIIRSNKKGHLCALMKKRILFAQYKYYMIHQVKNIDTSGDELRLK